MGIRSIIINIYCDFCNEKETFYKGVVNNEKNITVDSITKFICDEVIERTIRPDKFYCEKCVKSLKLLIRDNPLLIDNLQEEVNKENGI